MAAKRATSEAKSGPEKAATERLVDEALEDTFPASDPPFFVGGGAAPPATKPDAPSENGERSVHRDKH